MNKKRELGQYFTRYNLFTLKPFMEWASSLDLKSKVILEPFAGENSLIQFLIDTDLCRRYVAFDINPQAQDVIQRDTLEDFPENFEVCVTNPPWLAKNSAKKMNIPCHSGDYDDLYKYSLEKCLSHCDYVVAIIPESFIRSNLFKSRLDTFISLTCHAFHDTNHPVGMALFNKSRTEDVKIYRDHVFIGLLKEIEKYRPPISKNNHIKFNQPKGNLGLIALDSCQEASIRFCDVTELSGYEVKKHGRHITIMDIPFFPKIKDYNAVIKEFRHSTQDVLLTSYRGIRKDGFYRRRLDWQLAKDIISYVS